MKGTSDGIILDIISMLIPRKFANDLVSGSKNSSKGHIVESASAICRKVQRFFRPTHTNWWLNFSGKKVCKKGISGKVVCLGSFQISMTELSGA